MSLQVALHHRTSYRYDRPVSLGPQVVRLRPAPHTSSRVLAYSLVVRPKKHFINWQQDPQANYLARLVFPDKTTELSFEVDLVVEMTATNPFDFFLEPSAERWPFEYDESLRDELAPYRRVAPATPLLAAWLAAIPREKQSTNQLLVGLNQKLAAHITYGVRLEPGLQTPEETLEKRAGSCRDTGWLLVHVLRHLGFAARFVSGYLIQLVADVKSLDGPSGPEADFVDLHAWCEVYLPGAGWIGLDPTSGLLAGEGHIPLAATAEPSSAAPVSGLVDHAETVFEHSMTVTRIVETPRVTKPYTDAQWSAILAAGQHVDRALEAGDVRLTMGGEPTFVSIDDPDGAQWNTEALGDDKLRLAKTLFARLQERHAQGGLAHVGQGKWYPGEPLPRWALSLFWRRDGAPLWNDPALLAPEDVEEGAARRADASSAEAFLCGVAKRLGFDAGAALPAYEDTYHYLLRERQLPANVDPLDAKLDDPLERTRLRRLFGEGLGEVAGWVLPVAKPAHATKWRTSPWRFREGHCFLLPGDSPMGLRLPLASLPWVDPKNADDDDVARTAMCCEARGGVLHVFMPPVERLEDYAELLTALEATAKALDQRIRIEGYTPPREPGLVALAVTPDPGVIEVNVQPEATWDGLVESTTFLYETAQSCRLSAEKFMVDGRHVGTGGGNHVVLGGATPEDSPFLRRPDLLRSFIAHFHQHPSLSYLFSGMFIGPTSQAPRVDEARNDSVYEMEIAFRELGRMLEKHEGEPPPWLVDRLFRDLLTDVTGNTHRAELCIDKMYSPDGSAGRLGLLELRGLEMPPHPRMSLVQQLLLRALVARFWKEPVAPTRLTRWGTTLHDRFMLPFFVWSDFEDVLADLAARGFELPAAWFAPHFEFRFPVVGELEARGMKLEIRCALEPWHVLGEDAVAGGTARYVDSSVERLQIRVTGFDAERWSIGCNGVRLPLQPTGREGEWVAGLRFRAWQPPRCLHPHLEVHAPLTIDWVDGWTERSVGGCEIHVAHPGGRNHDARPVNALEAEGRRRARFVRHGHTPGKTTLRDVPPSIELPFTLDLRTVSP